MSSRDDPTHGDVASQPTRPVEREPGGPRWTAHDAELLADASTRVGQSFGRFEIRDVLGTGGMATVFEAHDRTLGRSVALKLLHPELAARSERRVLREAQALAKLSHPNVVQVFEAGLVEGRPFIAMELVRGRTLAQWQATPRPWRELVRVYLQAGRGLAAAHARGLVHRDFKPSNCILDDDGRVRVLDFGLARPIDAAVIDEALASRISTEGPVSTERARHDGRSLHRAIAGTLGYMPLEQLWDQPLDAKSDQFSFCVSLFEGLHGRRPFHGETVDALVGAMLDGRLDVPPGPTKLPARLRLLLERGLQARPAARWSGMGDVLRELEQLAIPPRRRRRWWAALAGIGATLVASGAWWSSRPPACEDRRGELEDAWSAESRGQVVAALERAGDRAPPELLPRLDAYAAQWLATRGAVCEAEQGGRVDEATAALRRRCLGEAGEALRETATLVGEDELLPLGPSWVGDLPELWRCLDTERFAPQRRHPADPVLADRVRALRRQWAHAQVASRAGRAEEALAILDGAIVEAAERELPFLLAELELLRGNVWIERGRYEEAERDLERAYARAMEHEHPHLALGAAIALAYVTGDLRERHDVGFKWGLTAEALARQPWSNPRRLADAMEIVGNVLYEQGRYAEALGRYEQALHTREALEPDHALEPLTKANIALVLQEQGRHEDALPLVHEVLERRRAELGPGHPAIAVSLVSLGGTLHRLGRHREALAAYEEALAIREQGLGPAHPEMVTVLNALGRLLLDMEEPARALAAHQRALAIGTAAALDPSHSDLAEAWLGLGRVLHAHGQLDAAARHVRRGADALERSMGPRHAYVGEALALLGPIELEQGERAAAREHLERAVAILEAAEGPPARLAAARFGLARVLSSFPGEHGPAVTLAQAARQAYAELGDVARIEADAVGAWLTTHESG